MNSRLFILSLFSCGALVAGNTPSQLSAPAKDANTTKVVSSTKVISLDELVGRNRDYLDDPAMHPFAPFVYRGLRLDAPEVGKASWQLVDSGEGAGEVCQLLTLLARRMNEHGVLSAPTVEAHIASQRKVSPQELVPYIISFELAPVYDGERNVFVFNLTEYFSR